MGIPASETVTYYRKAMVNQYNFAGFHTDDYTGAPL